MEVDADRRKGITVKRALAILALLLFGAGVARADCQDPPKPPVAPDATAAERLFVEAKQLLKDGKVAAARDLLEKSYELDPAGGTSLQLAYTLELQGALASSVKRYQQALDLAHIDKNERREELAREHLAALAPRLAKITIQLSSGAGAILGLEIRLDGLCIEPASLNTGIAVDPGTHTIDARAPGRVSIQRTIDVTQEGSTTVIAVPGLAAGAGFWQEPPREAPPVAVAAPTGSLVPGIVMLGGAAACLGAGVIAGLSSRATANDVKATCRDSVCPPSERSQADHAESLATVSTAAFVVGGALAIGGVGLLVFRPFGSTKASAAVVVAPGSLRLAGAF